ncbi:hypothetical protein BDM02DRAFT_3099970 [Thelephora ganbajun]|uniref:Uncharacterized protein n=1 Tax=Thelephora ganbajun TaxID=370292 RepID=A0ACB6Z9H6_THEGA|nr:hypothetical protein BDM02DRAFT_3099970 [Thelephora ganbajun]
MAIISLPLTFNNSFWSQDYRTGLDVIFKKLEQAYDLSRVQGIAENDEIVAFVRARAVAEGAFAVSLKNQPTSRAGTGFQADDGASLLMTFRGLQAESAENGQLHEAVSNELRTLVAGPFQAWTEKYKTRLAQAKEQALQGWIGDFEEGRIHVERLKEDYIEKSRLADEAEDDARFVSNEVTDRYTSPSSSPRNAVHNIRKTPIRQPTLSERVTQGLRGLGRSTASAITDKSPPAPPLQVFDAEDEKSPNPEPRLNKGKGKATEADLSASPPPLSPPLPPKLSVTVSEPESEKDVGKESQKVLLAGLPFNHQQISALLTRAKAEMPLRPVRFPILGEYQDCFAGEEFVGWLLENVPEFQKDLDIVLVAARELTEREDLLRRLGEFGNKFDNADDVFYQFRPKAFTLGLPPSAQTGTKSPLAASPLQRIAPEIAKTSGSFVDIVSKAWASSAEPPFIRCRREAANAEAEYRKAVRALDRHRLKLEEKIEETLKALQTWESDRLHAVKSALLQYQGSISSLRKSYEASADRSSTIISAYNPDSDLKALIERYRTGPFRPRAHVFESITHEEGDSVFGIDLRKWAEGGWGSDEIRRDSLPPVLTTLLNALNVQYGKIPDDPARRKIWIYEVPLNAVHHLRETLNAVPEGQDIPEDILEKYDAPVLAAAVKLWLLELDPPLGLYDAWDEFRKIYPSIGSATKTEQSQEQRFEAVTAALLKFPKVHLSVLDAILQHLKFLIDNTETDESNEVYVSKLALAIGRGILRPRFENERSIQDRHATMLFVDLIQHYDSLLPSTLAQKKRESERKIPQRKRTAMIDMRMRRSNLSEVGDLKEAIIQQNTRRTGPGSRSSISTTTGPPESVKVLTSGQDSKANVPSILRAGGGATNTSPVPPPPQIVAPSPTLAFVAPPPPPPLATHAEFVTPPPPPGFVPPPPPPPLTAESEEGVSSPEPQPPHSDNLPAPDDYVPPPMPTFRDPSDGPSPKASPTPASDPPSRSSSPAIGGINRPGALQRGTSGLRGPRTGGATRGPRNSGMPPAPGRRESYGQQTRPQTPPSPNVNNPRGSRSSSRGQYNPSAHRRSGSGSSFARRTMASDAEVN